MKNRMKNKIYLLLFALLARCPLAAKGLELYSAGRTLSDQGIFLEDLAEGHLAETSELPSYKPILRLTSLNYFSGSSLGFKVARDLKDTFNIAEELLTITFKVANAETILGKEGKQRNKKNVKSLPKSMRLILKTSDGKNSEVYIPLDVNEDYKNEWCKIGVPLRGISGFDQSNKLLSEFFIATEDLSTLYIQSISFSRDSTSIDAQIKNKKNNFALGDEVVFDAVASGGASILDYSWSFDQKYPLRPDSFGQQVKRRFYKPGKFLVTLMVQDRYKLKKPATQSMFITINP